MNYERSFREFKLSKIIPLHYQKRALANYSNGSFNASYHTGIYKNKIKDLLKSNRLLAQALQNDKVKKEELLAESIANAELIMFSRLKLADMSTNLKKVVSSLDEALLLLQLHSTNSVTKCSPKNTMCLKEFKSRLKEIVMDPIAEQFEPSIPENDESTIAQPNKNIFPSSLKNGSSDSLSDQDLTVKSIAKSSNRRNLSGKPKEMLVKSSPLKEISDGKKSSKSPQTSAKSSDRKCVYNSEKNSSKSCITNKILKENKSLCLKSKPTKKSKPTITKPEGVKKSKAVNEYPKQCEKTEDINKFTNTANSTECSFITGISQKNAEDQNQSKNVTKRKRQKPIINKNMNTVNSRSYITRWLAGNDSIFKNLPLNSLNKKDNLNTTELDNFPHKKFKLFQQEDELNINKSSIKKSALKDISSDINIENLQRELKDKNSLRSDDLMIKSSPKSDMKVKNKSYQYHFLSDTKSLITNKSDENLPPSSEIKFEPSEFKHPKNFFDGTLKQGEQIVENLAKSTFLVTAEVHKLPVHLTAEKKAKRKSTDCVHCMQPEVHLTDIFETGKSICKSMSNPLSSEQNNIPLEIQLLQHCSSLKLLPSESIGGLNRNSSNEVSSFPSSSLGNVSEHKNSGDDKGITDLQEHSENECKEQPNGTSAKKRNFRKRSSVCYKELPSNIKMRR